MNVVVLQGLLASPIVVRDLPAGGVALSFDVSTRTAGGVVSVPASWVGPSTVPTWEVGQELTVVGVVRRRFFRSGGSTQSRTEVAVSDAVLTRKRTSARKLLEQVAAGIAEAA
jgi:single-strand DNA-binding protein